MAKKIKTLRVSLLFSILCIITSGINYLNNKLPVVGILLIVISVAFIIQVVAYTIEMKNIKNNSVK
ncbi:hypothetical protein BSK49_07575 [Paenibacillus odorifer]|uniref:Uncharacterized protein n=1 Tax=Paenibacillus odorifer TaxID=189426 RepID=A0ABX3GK87_9BACL|nr:hypothetical protein [Paenibacillus odorifer]OMD20598.1 hypothetical protein BSO21_24345 [Paenibacillus odorifer]OMD91182.1 hypothetical protein BSK49_07575 [Paenibacillus odorifer]